ncbi:MAG: DUF349 domain-containing protein, partial [Pseudomonadota bacterium]
LAEQNPDPSLLRLCEEAESKGGSRSSLTQLRTKWQKAWQQLKTHNAAEQALKKRFDSALEAHAALRADAAQKREAAANALETALAELEQAVEAGDLQTAAKILERSQNNLKAAGGKHARQADLNELRGRVRELRQWQHWSNNEVRQRLVGHAEAIAGSGMHPDAVAARVKELRQRWKTLDASERLPGDRPGRLPNPKLFRQFQEACDAAFEPARPYFEKRAELRDEHLKELIGICETLEATESDGNNWDELARQVGTARRSLRRLRKVPHKERAALARRLRAGADRLDELLKDHYEVVERRKQAVIRDVTTLIEEPDLKQAIDQAKAAQKRWQAAGRLPRRREQKLWETYRAAADQVFGRLDQEKAAQRAERAADREKLESLIAEARALDPTGADVGRAMDVLHQRWREAGAGDRRLEQQFSEVMEKVATAADRHRRGEAAGARERWRELAGQCHGIEQGKSGDLASLKVSLEDSTMPAALRARCERILSDAPLDDADRAAQHEALLELCIQAEFLAGLETPPDFSEARMAYQVKRLSDRMGGGGETLSMGDEADALEQRWLGLGPLPAGGDGAQQRMLSALRKLDEAR